MDNRQDDQAAQIEAMTRIARACGKDARAGAVVRLLKRKYTAIGDRNRRWLSVSENPSLK